MPGYTICCSGLPKALPNHIACVGASLLGALGLPTMLLKYSNTLIVGSCKLSLPSSHLAPTIVDSAKLTRSRERQRRHLRCGPSEEETEEAGLTHPKGLTSHPCSIQVQGGLSLSAFRDGRQKLQPHHHRRLRGALAVSGTRQEKMKLTRDEKLPRKSA